MRSKRDRWLTFIIGVVAVSAFFITSFVALVWANGLTFDKTNRNFQQTAVIAVETRIIDADFFVNDRQIGIISPLQERGLPPGQYELRISKAGFVDYHKTFQLSAGEVGIVPKYVELLASTPKIITGQTDRSYTALSPLEVGLVVENGELTDNNVLITRFGTDPLLVRRFNGGYLYQIDAELRLYFPDNASDVLIRALPLSEVAKVNLDVSKWAVTVFEADSTATTIFLTESNAN